MYQFLKRKSNTIIGIEIYQNVTARNIKAIRKHRDTTNSLPNIPTATKNKSNNIIISIY